MHGIALTWAGVPHDGDGVVFQLCVDRGSQRFHIPRAVLRKVFGLARAARDSQQLELFYAQQDCIGEVARGKRAVGRRDTVPLAVSDFSSVRHREAL